MGSVPIRHAHLEIGSHSATGAGPRLVRKYPPICAPVAGVAIAYSGTPEWVIWACRAGPHGCPPGTCRPPSAAFLVAASARQQPLGAGRSRGTAGPQSQDRPGRVVAQDVQLPPGDDHPKRLRATVRDDKADAGAPLGAGGLGKAGLGRPGGGTDLGIVRQASTGGNPDELDCPRQYRRLPPLPPACLHLTQLECGSCRRADVSEPAAGKHDECTDKHRGGVRLVPVAAGLIPAV